MLEDIKMNKNFILLILAFFSFIYFVEAQTYCSGVLVCPQISDNDNVLLNYSIDCKSVSDGFCPTNYAKNSWNSCPNTPTGKCYPCDPDCSECSPINLYVPDAVDYKGDINVFATKTYAQQVNLKIDRNWGNIPNGVTEVCGPQEIETNNGICRADFNEIYNNLPEQEKEEFITNFPGNLFVYLASTTGNEGGDIVQGEGRVRPKIQLFIDREGEQTSQELEKNTLVTYGDFNIDVKPSLESSVGIVSSKVEVYKYDIERSGYFPINLDKNNPEDYCSFRCPAGECTSLIAYFGESPYQNNVNLNGIFEIGKCEDAKYTVNVTAIDANYYSTNPPSSDGVPGREGSFGVNLIIDNQVAKCTDNCPIFTSKTLQIVLAKIRTWVNYE